MKTLNPDHPIRNTLKHLALGLAAAAAFITTGPSAKANVTYDFSTGLQGWTQIYPTSGALWSADFGWPPATGSLGHLGAGWNDSETQMGRSPEFKLDGTGDLTFQTHGSKSSLAAVGVTPSTVPATAIDLGGFCGLALRDVATNTYVLSKGQSAHLYGTFTTLKFTAAELAPYFNDGKMYTLDWIDYDKDITSNPGGDMDGWGWLVNVSIPTLKTDCDITVFGTNVAGSSAVINTTSATEGTVEWTVPFGTTLGSLAPTYTLSSAATCNKTSGAIPTPDFSSAPLHYIVTAEDGTTTRDYTVSVIVNPPSSDCDITAFGTNVGGSSAVITNDVTTGTVAWALPPGTDLASLAPTFALSLAATCDRTSGAIPTPNFSTGSLHYVVTAQDGTTMKDYTVTATVLPSPPVTAGMIVWLPAGGVNTSDPDQVRIAGSDTFVKQWKDWSSNANNATQTTEGDQPTYIASGAGGKPVVRFSGGSSKMNLADLSSSFPSAASVFAVITPNNDNMYSAFGNRNNDERWMGGNWSEVTPGGFRGGRANFSGSYSLMPTTGSHVFAYESDSSAYKFLLNGNLIGTASADYNSGSGRGWTIGTNGSGNGAELNGDIAELILYDRVLTLAEADQVGTYLATKYGLTTIYGPPAILTYTPPDGGTTAATSDLVLTFNKAIAIGTGNITLKNLTDTTQTVIPIEDAQVSISGAVLTINPTDDLVLGKDYAVQIDTGAIKALSDVPFAGILDDETWNFATAPPTATTIAVVSSGTPSIYGGSVTFTATVSPIPSGGTVQFFSDVFGSLGTPVAVNTTSGEASVTTTMLGVATHAITAEYSGNYQFEGSTSDSYEQVVDQAPLTVTAMDMFRLPNTANPDPLPFQITGFKNGQNLGTSGVTGTPALSTTAVLESPVGPYPITCAVGDLAANNYSFTSFVDGILTVADVADTFSVNFYSFGGLNTVEQRANVLMAPGVPAGLGDWFTSGWRNVEAPWGGGLQPAVTLTSNKASTATFLFKDCRNGWSSWGEPRTTNLGVGNYNMMGAGVNSTLDGESNKFDMEMTNIPFGTYDVICYFRANQPQYGDGTGVIKFNGGADRAFTLKSGAFDGTFIEMVDATTVGNYIVFTGVTGSSFTVQTWGTGGGGFNHLGPAGFQIRQAAVAPGYGTWAATNAPGQTPDQDYDNDGVENGIEYFMGETGSSFTAMPGLDATNKVTWKMSAAFEGTYEVQTSPDLVTWTNVAPKPMPSGGTLSYTLPTGLGKQFVRLLVAPAP